MRTATSNRQFAVGFATAILLLAAGALALQTWAWVMTHPQPQAFFELLQRPMFSIIDVMSAVVGLLVLALFITVPVWGPRP